MIKCNVLYFNHPPILLLSNFSNDESKQVVVVGCKGGQVLIVRIGKISSYEHKYDLSFPAELEWIKLGKLSKTGSLKVKSSGNYAIDLSGMKLKGCVVI